MDGSPPVDEPDVRVVGYLSRCGLAARRRLGELYGAGSCPLLLSCPDCFPVLLEAQLVGVPVAGQGRPEAGDPSRSSMLVHVPDPTAVADATETGLADEAISPAAGGCADERFTWPLVVDHALSKMGMAAGAKR